jgi:hypothetical protein
MRPSGKTAVASGHDQSCATDGATTEMHEMPVVRQPVSAGVLTHRRDKDAVDEFDIANRERIEQVSHENTLALHIALSDKLVLPRNRDAPSLFK